LCVDNYTDVSSYFVNGWKTGSTAITTVNYMGTYTGVAVGSTTAGTCGSIPTGQQRNCPAYLRCLNGTADVRPVITSISPAQGLIGVTRSSVNITGTGLTGATVNGGTGITPTVKSTNNTTVVVDLAVASNAAAGNHAITVTANGQTSNSVNFFVQIPTHLGRVGEPCTSSSGIGPLVTGTNLIIKDCAGNTVPGGSNVCGGYQLLTYYLIDQTGNNRIQNGLVTFTESFSNFSPPTDPIPANPGSSKPDLSTQVLADIYAMYASAPTCPPPNLSDSFDQTWTATVGSTVYNLATVIHITRATNSQGFPSFTTLITTP
jgi:Quinohemoprotein amine dehydrogenase, alpha subunit domain III